MKVKISKYPTHRFYHNWLYDWFGYSPKQSIKINIDTWDTWNMDETLAHIILPMLKQLKKSKHSYPSELENEAQWDDIITKMIFSFNSKLHDWEEQFQSGEHDVVWTKNKDGSQTMDKGPNHTFEIDKKGMKKYKDRIDEGFQLFGKYYENLWD
ncbi:MAG: hypothetical protein CBD74_13380 [Saprospirales bacterium TMED214]|nr:MAG: hypothetical protein CBD74_13380 [Saprospirales bacterium TMED214]